MSNPFVNKNNFINGMNMSSIRNAYQLLMNSSNPQYTFTQLVKNNPQLKPIAQALQQGANPKDIFYQMCEQRGIDPQQFLREMSR